MSQLFIIIHYILIIFAVENIIYKDAHAFTKMKLDIYVLKPF
jgi:hypothetical protein